MMYQNPFRVVPYYAARNFKSFVLNILEMYRNCTLKSCIKKCNSINVQLNINLAVAYFKLLLAI